MTKAGHSVYAPVVLFVYNRLELTKRTVAALQRNVLAAETDLIIFSDAAKNPKDEFKVNLVRAFISSLTGFRSVSVHLRDVNFGLSHSIIGGVTTVVNEYGSVIVLEDDLITSQYFLQFMNDGLKKYREDPRVASINGYNLPIKGDLPEVFFSRGADCWGWGTWKNEWAHFNHDGLDLLNRLQKQDLVNAFDLDGAIPNSDMLREQIEGKNDSWAIRWHASAFLDNKLTLYPCKSLVSHIGNDGSGTHAGISDFYDTNIASDRIIIGNPEIRETMATRQAIKAFYFLNRKTIRKRILLKIKNSSLIAKATKTFKRMLPSLIYNFFRNKIKRGLSFQGPFATWEDALKKSSGYDAEIILNQVAAATEKVVSGVWVYERDSVGFNEIQYSWPISSNILRAALKNDGCLNLIDFGGALGSSFFQNQEFLSDLKELNWCVVEQPSFVSRGKRQFQTSDLHFFSTIAECGNFLVDVHVILLSGVLQYLENPYDILDQVISVRPQTILIDLTIVCDDEGGGVYIQNVPEQIYKTSYPVRPISESKLIEYFGLNGYSMRHRFNTLDFAALGSINSKFLGYTFERETYE